MGYSIDNLWLHKHCFNHRTYACFYHEDHHRFYQWVTNHRTNTPHHVMELIYLRSTVVFIYGVYKYTTVDINTPYRRFKLILWWFFLLLYMCYSPRIFSFVYIYMYMSTVFYICIYTYISPLFLYIYTFIY